jgi:hypothetical protein
MLQKPQPLVPSLTTTTQLSRTHLAPDRKHQAPRHFLLLKPQQCLCHNRPHPSASAYTALLPSLITQLCASALLLFMLRRGGGQQASGAAGQGPTVERREASRQAGKCRERGLELEIRGDEAQSQGTRCMILFAGSRREREADELLLSVPIP